VLRVGFIDYLNCLPLRLGLEATGGLEGVELVTGPPATVNAALLRGEVDVAVVSTAAWARNAGWLRRLPGFGIASDGEVMSVLLARREGGRLLAEARSVALTNESATSHVLAQVLLERFLGSAPLYEVVAGGPEEVLRRYDAALFIGDTALRVRRMLGTSTLDLGGLWRERTGLPMVYAVWAARGSGVDARRLAEWERRVEAAVSWADENLDVAVREALQREAPGSEVELKDYFGRAIRYRVGPREEEGLVRFVSEGGLLSGVEDRLGRVSA
jgi:chorismate dehydratase